MWESAPEGDGFLTPRRLGLAVPPAWPAALVWMGKVVGAARKMRTGFPEGDC
jgi:hypothetical protein